ncbi:porin [Aquitalea magnusonii]|uniref:Putative porin n=1 Tax=Aquitalea magnusonii TaxID=332411 RepID=A0A318J9D5_9NEIS|nr:porin [Aquitalea magnusonii]PXX43421.1 putative porin [Aquitalea magnusonii]
MKKLVLVAAIAAAMPVLAQADVTIYGSIRAGLDSMKSTDTNFKSSTGVDDFASRIGFKGSEDLGNGLKAIWQVETGLNVDGVATSGTGSGTFANRTSFVGVEGNFGKVRLGYIDDVLGETESTDNLYGPRRDASTGMAFPLYEGTDVFGAYGDGRVKNGVRYDSPDLNGFNAMVHLGSGEAQAAGGKKTGNTLGTRLAYANAGFFGAYAYMAKYNTVADHNSGVHRVEFGYDANNLYLAATLQKTTLWGDAWAKNTDGSYAVSGIAGTTIANTGANKLTSRSWALNAAYTIGAFKPSFVYSKRSSVKVDGQSQDWGASQWAAALDYTLSKRTMVEAGYGQVKEDKGAQTAQGWAQDKATITWLMLKHNF